MSFMRSRSKFLCLGCKKDTGKMGEHYFIKDEVWLQVHKSKTGMLCIGCLEKRLGRQLNAGDFTDCYINHVAFGTKSQRLLNRLKQKV